MPFGGPKRENRKRPQSPINFCKKCIFPFWLENAVSHLLAIFGGKMQKNAVFPAIFHHPQKGPINAVNCQIWAEIGFASLSLAWPFFAFLGHLRHIRAKPILGSFLRMADKCGKKRIFSPFLVKRVGKTHFPTKNVGKTHFPAKMRKCGFLQKFTGDCRHLQFSRFRPPNFFA